MAFGLMTEAEHERQMRQLNKQLESALRDVETYKTSRIRLLVQIAQLDAALTKAKTDANKKGCGSDEAEQLFDKTLRIDTAKSVMRMTLTTEGVLNFGRNLFIAGFKAARR